jgi:hypothetical protein
MKNMESPNDPIARPGRPALQGWSQAQQAAEDHNRWHREHPGEACDPKMFPMDNWEDIARGDRLLVSHDFEAGDAFGR